MGLSREPRRSWLRADQPGRSSIISLTFILRPLNHDLVQCNYMNSAARVQTDNLTQDGASKGAFSDMFTRKPQLNHL